MSGKKSKPKYLFRGWVHKIGILGVIASCVLFAGISSGHYKACLPVGKGSGLAIPGSCTTFAAQIGDTVLFGNNEDYSNPNTLMWVVESSEDGYGGVYFGYEVGKPQGGVNEMGLAWDGLALPPSPLNRQTGQTNIGRSFTRFMAKIMAASANVEEAIENSSQYFWGTTISHQILIADSSGDAAVIGAGANGELVVTRKSVGNGHLAATNVNLANPENTETVLPCWRYETASEMLEQVQNRNDLTVESVRDILDAVHQEGANNNTLYSNIFDLKNGVIYLYYWHQYDEVVTLKVAEEIAKAPYEVEIRELYSENTIKQAETEFLRHTGEIMLVEEYLIVGWYILSTVCLLILVGMFWKDKAAPSYFKLVWAAAVLFLGPLGMLAFWFTYQQPQKARQSHLSSWQQAVGGAAISSAGYAASFLLILLTFFIFFPEGNSGPATLIVPLVVGLLAIRSPMIAALTKSRYTDVVRRAVLVEISSEISAVASIIFINSRLIDYLGDLYSKSQDPTQPLFWGMISLFALGSFILIYPLHYWLAGKGFSVWLMGFGAEGKISNQESKARYPSLRQVWMFIPISVILLVLAAVTS